jgi:hypothetical protein
MRADYSKVDLGAGVRGKYLKDYYAVGEGKSASKAAKGKEAPLPPKRKRR